MKDAGLPYSKDSLLDKLLKNYPLSSFKNIITVEDFPDDDSDDDSERQENDSTKRKNGVSALYSMRRFIIETLIEAFNEENDLQTVYISHSLHYPSLCYLSKTTYFLTHLE